VENKQVLRLQISSNFDLSLNQFAGVLFFTSVQYCRNQGTLTEGKSSVQLTSLLR
jgi:hypothetical protein